MSKYNPLDGLKNARRAMDSYVRKHERPLQLVNTNLGDVPLTSTATEPGVCVVLLKSFSDGVRDIVPDDFFALRTAQQLKDHVRPDGAVYLGAFDLQNTPESTVLVYGPASLAPEKVERLATLERPALMRRHAQAALGPFANPDPSPAPLSA